MIATDQDVTFAGLTDPLDTPALDGLVVTEGHAAYCRVHGHARHTVNGKVQTSCPRCGGHYSPAVCTNYGQAMRAERKPLRGFPGFSTTSYRPGGVGPTETLLFYGDRLVESGDRGNLIAMLGHGPTRERLAGGAA